MLPCPLLAMTSSVKCVWLRQSRDAGKTTGGAERADRGGLVVGRVSVVRVVTVRC